MDRKIKLFSMFSGYGGAEFALNEAGVDYEVVAHSEIDPYAVKLYEQNHGKVPNFGDCQQIRPKELPSFDLLTGGFPCQAFSVTGKKQGELDPRGTLVYDIIRIAEYHQPKWIVLENVKGFASKAFEGTFKKVVEEFERIGYNVKWAVLNTKDYDVPQDRERLVFVMVRKDLPNTFEFPLPRPRTKSVNDVLCYYAPNSKYYLKEETLKRIHEPLSVNEVHKIHNNMGKQSRRRDGLCYTLTREGRNSGYNTAVLTQYGVRRLSPQDCFRLQGFLKDEIDISGLSDNQLYKLAGNGWSINVFAEIFNVLLK